MTQDKAEVHFESDGGITIRPTKACLDRVLDLIDLIEAKEAEGMSEEEAFEAVLGKAGPRWNTSCSVGS